jgi:hypothetical protein
VTAVSRGERCRLCEGGKFESQDRVLLEAMKKEEKGAL